MIPITALWLPILVAAVLVFVVSSVIHMFTTFHKNDFKSLPDEDAALNVIRPLDIPPGDYFIPYAGSTEAMRSDQYRERVERGPVAILTVMRPGELLSMGPQLAQWFAYSLLVGCVAAYLAGRMLDASADYLTVFRVTGTVAFACYAMSLPQRSIWFKQNWGATLRSMVDGLVYAAVTAGAFGWLWPA